MYMGVQPWVDFYIQLSGGMLFYKGNGKEKKRLSIKYSKFGVTWCLCVLILIYLMYILRE